MKDNIFEENVIVPISVLQKIDVALDETKPENNHNKTVKKAVKSKKSSSVSKILIRGGVAAVASAAVVLTAVYGSFHVGNNAGVSEFATSKGDTKTKGLFTITANASELVPGEPVALSNNENILYRSFQGSPEGDNVNKVYFTMPTPFTVEGEGIKAVTYSINNGAFQLLTRDENQLFYNEKPWDTAGYDYSIVNNYEGCYISEEEMSEEMPQYKVNYYTEFTIDYDKQAQQKDGFNFVGSFTVDDETFALIFPDADIYQANAYEERNAEGLDRIMKNIMFTITAYYEDGTSDTQYINLGGMTTKDIYTDEPDAIMSTISCTLYTDLPTVGCTDSAEYKACAEYNAFLDTYDENCEILNQIGNSTTEFDVKYGAYLCYTQEMADKIDEICAKYNLSLIDWNSFKDFNDAADYYYIYGHQPFTDLYYGDFTGYCFSDGSFHADGNARVEDKTIDYQIERHVKGTFSTVMLRVNEYECFKQWDYTTREGETVKLFLGSDKALIQLNHENSFIFVNVLNGTSDDWLNNGVTINEAELEALAEAFRFSKM